MDASVRLTLALSDGRVGLPHYCETSGTIYLEAQSLNQLLVDVRRRDFPNVKQSGIDGWSQSEEPAPHSEVSQVKVKLSPQRSLVETTKRK